MGMDIHSTVTTILNILNALDDELERLRQRVQALEELTARHTDVINAAGHGKV